MAKDKGLTALEKVMIAAKAADVPVLPNGR